MTRDIKFTSFGIPYILEFENVSFVPEPTTQCACSPSSSSESFCYIESPPPPPRFPSFSLRSASSLFKRKPTQPVHSPVSEATKPLPLPPTSDSHGIYIQFPPDHSLTQMSRKKRLIQLQKTISMAVLDAGMSRSPGSTAHPDNHSSDVPPHRTRRYRPADALFCGTYGQLMAALEGAGLSATPLGVDLSGYTRLGALFVARNNGASGVQLRKITLWG